MYKIFYESSKTVVGNKKIYGYYQGNTSSITKSRNAKKVNDAIQALEERLDFLDSIKNMNYTECHCGRIWFFL